MVLRNPPQNPVEAAFRALACLSPEDRQLLVDKWNRWARPSPFIPQLALLDREPSEGAASPRSEP